MMDISQKYSKSRQKGNLGEDIACLFLMKQGFAILDRNYLRPWGEIDIVATKSEKLHFVEVKSVSSSFIKAQADRCEMNQKSVSRETVTHETLGRSSATSEALRPEENMTEYKLKKLERVIKTYFMDKKLSRETMFQVDLITVRIDATSKTAIVEKFDTVGA